MRRLYSIPPSCLNDNGVVRWASKHARRKGRYMKGYDKFIGTSQFDKRQFHRAERRRARTEAQA